MPILSIEKKSIPTWAYQGTPSTPDTYETSHRTPAASRCNYPDVGCNCRNPGVAIGNPSPPFPIYYTYRQCNDGDIRVSLNLFYEKDGAYWFGQDTGHELYVFTPSLITLFYSSYCTLGFLESIAVGKKKKILTNDWLGIGQL